MEKTVNGIKYDFQGRFNTKKEADDIAKVWKRRDLRTIVEKADTKRSAPGYWVWIESW